jgi:hypothetical protein
VKFKILSEKEFDAIPDWDSTLRQSGVLHTWDDIKWHKLSSDYIKMTDYEFYIKFIIPTYGTKLGQYLHGR